MTEEKLKNLEKATELLAQMSNDDQQVFYKTLLDNGFSSEDVLTLQKHVFFYKLQNNKGFYEAVMQELGEWFWKKCNK